MAGAGHVFLYQRGCPGYGRVTVWPELPVVAVFFLGSAPGLVTARQDWSERMTLHTSGDTARSVSPACGWSVGPARQRGRACRTRNKAGRRAWPHTPAEMCFMAGSEYSTWPARQRRCGWLLCARTGEILVLLRYLTPAVS